MNGIGCDIEKRQIKIVRPLSCVENAAPPSKLRWIMTMHMICAWHARHSKRMASIVYIYSLFTCKWICTYIPHSISIYWHDIIATVVKKNTSSKYSLYVYKLFNFIALKAIWTKAYWARTQTVFFYRMNEIWWYLLLVRSLFISNIGEAKAISNAHFDGISFVSIHITRDASPTIYRLSFEYFT